MLFFPHPLAAFQSIVDGYGLPTRFHPSSAVVPEEVNETGRLMRPLLIGPRRSQRAVVKTLPRTNIEYPRPTWKTSVLADVGNAKYPPSIPPVVTVSS